MRKCNAIVIGAGQARRSLAHRLADKDGTIALVEREYLGATCADFGCTPTKTMLASAQVALEGRLGAEPDVRVDGRTATRQHALGAAIWRPGGNSSRRSWRS
jgi:pyruvate/2-oxoglutarate dehydrogenase complex dihydrolipoamide dehydrogenase (E3) component